MGSLGFDIELKLSDEDALKIGVVLFLAILLGVLVGTSVNRLL